jgi:hypothetical protein
MKRIAALEKKGIPVAQEKSEEEWATKRSP